MIGERRQNQCAHQPNGSKDEALTETITTTTVATIMAAIYFAPIITCGLLIIAVPVLLLSH